MSPSDDSYNDHNLPTQSTSFVGREADIESISATLAEEHCRLLTLMGMGGIGKTRLALAVASSHLKTYGDGVFLSICNRLRMSIRLCLRL